MSASPIGRRAWATEFDRISREDLLAFQLRGLKDFLRRLEVNPYWARRLKGFDADKLETAADLRHLPFDSKEAFLTDVKAVPPYGARLGVPIDQLRELQTSGGTSGRGTEVYAHNAQDIFDAGHPYAEMFVWAGFEPGMPVALPIPVGLGAAGLLAPRACETIGALPLRLGAYSTARRVQLMHEFAVGGMFTGNVYLDALRDQCETSGLGPPNSLSTIVYAGSAYTVEWAERQREYWRSELHEMYGSSQVGSALCSTCEAGVPVGRRGLMHAFEWATAIEVVDPVTLEPIEYGGEGELVVTPFYRRASPILRYRTGDKVRWMPPGICECGRPYISIETGTITRYDDMFKIKMVNVWASEVDAIVLEQFHAREYTALIGYDEKRRETVTLTVYADSIDVNELQETLKHKLTITFNITQRAAAEAPIFTIKPKRWRDERSV